MRERCGSWSVGMLAGAALGALSLPAYAQSPVSASEVRELAEAIQPHVVEWRRHLHANPELGFAEHDTAEYVAEHLRGLGLEVRTGVAATGVIAILRGGAGDGPVVALRADMDALPVREATG
ncbi:MAG: amidohydrolase, partial [Brevundimonas sp.]